MKKLLLSVIAASACMSMAAAETTIVFKDLAADQISGNRTETTYKEDGTVKEYGKYQPLESITAQGYTLTFDQNGAATAPALYDAKNGNNISLRLYWLKADAEKGTPAAGNTITISGPAFKSVVMTFERSSDVCTLTPSTGTASNADNKMTWTSDASVSSVTFEVGKTTRFSQIVISTDAAETPETPDVTVGTGAGTLDSPYDCVRALAIANAGGSADNVYIAGTISAIKEVSTSFGNATYSISNDGTTTDQLLVFRGYYLDGVKFTDENAIKVGDKVVILGKLVTYNDAPQVNTGSSIIKLENGGSTVEPDPTPDPTPVDGALYSALLEDDATISSDWTLEDGTLPEGLSYVWSWKGYQGKYYLNASAYVNSVKYATDAYAYTTLDLTKASNATLTFDHAAKFQTNLRQDCRLVVRENGATAWTALAIPTWPEAGSWSFVNSGEISLDAYAGKTIQIGFNYVSTDAAADTWEIRNFIVKGELSGIENIDADNADAPVEYFNLQGQRVANPANGLFIRRQGNKTVKVVL